MLDDKGWSSIGANILSLRFGFEWICLQWSRANSSEMYIDGARTSVGSGCNFASQTTQKALIVFVCCFCSW